MLDAVLLPVSGVGAEALDTPRGAG